MVAESWLESLEQYGRQKALSPITWLRGEVVFWRVFSGSVLLAMSIVINGDNLV